MSDCPVGYNLIQGTAKNDTLTGTAGNDCILGLGGEDTIYGGGGNDYIAGGGGDDHIYGEAGNDQLFGETGADTIEGGDGDDAIDGAGGLDTLNGGAGRDSIVGGDTGDTIHGGDGDDVIHGDGGNDQLYGDDGDDVIDGDANADSIWGGNGDDVLYGDVANDNLHGDAGDDALIGGGGTNTSDGGGGTDACSGTSCEKPELTLSGCTQNSQCSSGKHCIADFGLCIGCVLDQDNDGLCDSHDGCPLDAAKSAPGACGCGVSDADSDADGTANCNDGCPADANKVAPGVCGCGVSDADSDGDGVANCNDGCATDPAKVAPGACGCGVADTDGDGDGVPNCNDGCPTDANKTAAGVCGCGTADTDSDGDGTPNCNDGCPADPNKVAPGMCGCGVSDADSDGDGVLNCFDACPGIADSSFDCLPPGQLRTRPLAQEVLNAGFTPQTTVGVLDVNPFHPFSADGSTIVGVQNDYSGTDDRAFRWTVSNGLEWLANLPPFGNPNGYPSNGAFSTSADGSIVGGSCWDVPFGSPAIEGCRWAGAPGSNPTPALLTTTARTKYTYATSWDGQAMVGAGEIRGVAIQTSAFRWTSSGVQTLGWLSSTGLDKAVASDVSADGSVVVGWSTTSLSWASYEPFKWTAAGGMVGLGFLTAVNGQSGRATAISADGQVIVGWTQYSHNCLGFCDPRFEPRAFRWTAGGGMQPLPLPPFQSVPASTATYAHAVSTDGSVVLGTSSIGSGYYVWTAQRGAEDMRDALIRLGVSVNGWTLSAIAVLQVGSTTYLTGYGQYQGGSPVVWRASFHP